MNTPCISVPARLDARPGIAFFNRGIYHPGLQHRFCLPHLWAIHSYEYESTLSLNEHIFRIQPGSITITPPGWVSDYDFPPNARHLCAHFSLSSTRHRQMSFLPLLTTLPARSNPYPSLLERAFQTYARYPLQGEVKLWDLLLDLARGHDTLTSPSQGGTHPAVEAVLQHLETHLADPASLTTLARIPNLSPIHLNRLFKSHLGVPTMTWLRRRRLDRAAHLLSHSTLPIKTIAHEVGIPDLHAFNKLIKKQFGKAPRLLRG